MSSKVSGGARDMKSEPSRLLGLQEAADYCHISYWTIRALVNGGHIPAVRFDNGSKRVRRTLLDRQDLDSFIESCKDLGA